MTRKIKILKYELHSGQLWLRAEVKVGSHIYNMQYCPIYGLFIDGVADAFEYLPNEADEIETILDKVYFLQ